MEIASRERAEPLSAEIHGCAAISAENDRKKLTGACPVRPSGGPLR